jgi:hypothetical protein
MPLMKEHMKIAKRHTLKHYIQLLGNLYGETIETTEEYAREVIQASDANLDEAITCFKDLVGKNGNIYKVLDKKETKVNPPQTQIVHRPSRLWPGGERRRQISSQGRDHELPDTKSR